MCVHLVAKDQCKHPYNLVRPSAMCVHLAAIDQCKHPYNLVSPSTSTIKPTLWTLRNVSTQISLRILHRLIRADTFRLRGIEV